MLSVPLALKLDELYQVQSSDDGDCVSTTYQLRAMIVFSLNHYYAYILQ